jgi:tryptophan-rich sensory protein
MTLGSAAEYYGLLVQLVIWYAFVPLGRGAGSGRPRAGDARFYAALATMPSPAVFGVVWFVLYGLIAGASFVYVRDAPPGTTTYTATAVASLVNLVTNKAWSVVFFEARAPTAALGVLAAVDVSAAVVVIGFAIDKQWLALGLYVPYVLWLLAATYLNVAFLRTLAAYEYAAAAAAASPGAPVVVAAGPPRYVPPQRRQ